MDQWLPYFQHDEKTGKMPQLTFMWLMTDHTTGTNIPDPVAQVADNDLAVGRVVDAISHSKFWKSTAIFVDEDDTQNGVDHVDGHRAPTLVISPYSKPGVDDQYYTQLNMVKTVEQVLGIHAMNQEDYAAEPMYGAFTETGNFAPYNVEPNIVPLNLGAPGGPTTFTPSVEAGSRDQEGRLRRRRSARRASIPRGDKRASTGAWQTWIAPAGRKGPLQWPGSRQLRAAEPLRLVLGTRLEGRLSGRSRRSTAQPGAGAQAARDVHRRRLTPVGIGGG